jgi:outer membrane lipoprotein-sorting protein
MTPFNNSHHSKTIEGRMQRQLAYLFPASEPSLALAERIAALAAQQELAVRHAQSRQFRWKLAAVLTIFLAAVGVSQMLRPQLAAAAMLARMDGAMRDARSAHCILKTLMPNGTWTKTYETWYQNSQWRMERVGVGHDVQIYTKGRLWVYEPATNTVMVDTQPGPFAFNSTGFSVSALLGSGALGATPQVRQLGDASYAGRAAIEIGVVTPNQERMIFWADPDTNLPFHFEAQRRVYGQWQTGVEGDMTYNTPLPASLFVPGFPRTAKVFDKDAGVEALHQRWVNGIAQGDAGGRLIVIRDVEVNPHGDVFILYTAGHRPDNFQDDISIDVKDDAGDDYRRGGWGRGFDPIFRDPKPAFMFGDEELEGFCQAPNPRDVFKAAHTLTVTFQRNTPPPMRPGTYHYYNVGRPMTFTLPITKRITTDLPDYMPYMAMPLDEDELTQMNTQR